MKRKLLWTGGILAALLLLPVLAVLTVMLLIDPNRFRGQIESAARERLGIALQLQGDLRWQWWPLLSIDIGNGRIADPAGGTPLVTWQQLSLGAAWAPLLHRQFVADRVEVQGLALNLSRDANGRGNWQALLDEIARRNASPPAQPAAAPSPLQVNSLRLREAQLQFADAANGATWRLQNLDLDTGFRYEGASSAASVDGVQLSATVIGGSFPPSGVPVNFETGSIAYAGQTGTLQMPAWTLDLGNARISGEQSGALGLSPLSGAGTLKVESPSVRELLVTLGITAPPTRDRNVLGKLTLETAWSLAAMKLNLSMLKIVADDTTLTGAAMWPLDQSTSAMLELVGDTVDFDRYLRPDDDPGEPFSLPIEALRAVDLNGSVAFATVNMRGLIVRGARFRLYSDDGEVEASSARGAAGRAGALP